MPFNELYNKFGYSTISCILPCEYLFNYDIPKIKLCADAVVDRLQKENVSEVVIHTLSGNGATLYQHFNQRIVEQKQIEIKGVIFDSGPNPMAWLAQLPIGLENLWNGREYFSMWLTWGLCCQMKEHHLEIW